MVSYVTTALRTLVRTVGKTEARNRTRSLWRGVSIPICLSLLLLGTGLGERPARGQSTYDLYGHARSDALGNSTTALPSASGVQANPASRAALEKSTVSFYARQSFGLSALRYGAAHVALPFDWGTVSSGLSSFGFDDYREVHASAGYARSFSLGTTRSFRAGVTLRYYHTSISGYGNASTVGVHLGLGVEILRSLHLGAYATNVNGAALADNAPLPRTLAVGVYYRALSFVRVTADVFKDIRFPAAVRGGIEVRPVDVLFVRAGITTTPTRFSGGVGIHLGPLRAGLAAEQHQELGWSPSASLQIHW